VGSFSLNINSAWNTTWNGTVNIMNFCVFDISFLNLIGGHFGCSNSYEFWIGTNWEGNTAMYLVYTYHSLIHSLMELSPSWQLCSYSRTSQNFMKPEGSLSCSKEPSTGPYSETDQSNPYHPILSL
jgi:hypothetical protein